MAVLKLGFGKQSVAEICRACCICKNVHHVVEERLFLDVTELGAQRTTITGTEWWSFS